MLERMAREALAEHRAGLSRPIEELFAADEESEVPILTEMIEQITPENRHPETDWGPPVGREVW